VCRHGGAALLEVLGQVSGDVAKGTSTVRVATMTGTPAKTTSGVCNEHGWGSQWPVRITSYLYQSVYTVRIAQVRPKASLVANTEAGGLIGRQEFWIV
jgi:hypothetical protein